MLVLAQMILLLKNMLMRLLVLMIFVKKYVDACTNTDDLIVKNHVNTCNSTDDLIVNACTSTDDLIVRNNVNACTSTDDLLSKNMLMRVLVLMILLS